MRGLIRYIPQVETPQQAFMESAFPLGVPYPLADTVQAGVEADIYLPNYSVLKPISRKSNKATSRATSGVVQSLFYSSQRSQQIKVDWIKEDRTALNSILVYNALNDALERGVFVKWFPDFDNYPAEFHSCYAEKISEAQRVGTQMLWDYTFNFIFLEDVQSISTVPSLL